MEMNVATCFPGSCKSSPVLRANLFCPVFVWVFCRIFMKGLDPLEVGRRPEGPSSKRPPSVVFCKQRFVWWVDHRFRLHTRWRTIEFMIFMGFLKELPKCGLHQIFKILVFMILPCHYCLTPSQASYSWALAVLWHQSKPKIAPLVWTPRCLNDPVWRPRYRTIDPTKMVWGSWLWNSFRTSHVVRLRSVHRCNLSLESHIDVPKAHTLKNADDKQVLW